MVMQTLNTGTAGKGLRIVLGIILFGAVAGLVLTDMGGFFRDGGATESWVAHVGDKDINIVTFGRTYQNTLQQNGVDDTTARQMGIPYVILEREINRHTLLQAAHKSGVRVPDSDAATFLKKQIMAIPGPGTPEDKLNQILQAQGMSPKTLLETLRGDMVTEVITGAVASGGLHVAEDVVLAPWRASREKRSARIITITPDTINKMVAVDNAAIKAFYTENKERYRTLQKRDGAFLVIPQSKAVRTPTISESDMREFYDTHRDQFMTAPRVRMTQIILQDEAEAQKIADEKPDDFASVKNDKADILPADWYSVPTLPKDIQKILGEAPQSGVYGPVKTTLGFHVLRVGAFEPKKPRSFDSVKNDIAKQLRDEHLDDQLARFSETLDEMVASGQSLNSIASEYGVKPVRINAITMNNAAQKLGALGLGAGMTNKITGALFETAAGDISPVIDTPKGDFLLVGVTDDMPARIPDLDDIRDTVRRDAEDDLRAKAMRDMAQKLADTALDKIPTAAGAAGLAIGTVDPAPFDAVAKRLDTDSARTLFRLNSTEKVAYVADGSNRARVIILGDIVRETGKPDAKTMEQLRLKAHDDIAGELSNAFLRAWRIKLDVAINHAAMQKYFTGPKKAE